MKGFIVRALACYDTPTQVADAVKEKFNLEVSRQQVATYDPENVVGKALSQKWREIFAETREKFKSEVGEIAIANQTYRLRVLNRLLHTAEKSGNVVVAASLLEQASKEVGGLFTNKQRTEHTGKDGKDLAPAVPVINLTFGT